MRRYLALDRQLVRVACLTNQLGEDHHSVTCTLHSAHTRGSDAGRLGLRQLVEIGVYEHFRGTYADDHRFNNRGAHNDNRDRD